MLTVMKDHIASDVSAVRKDGQHARLSTALTTTVPVRLNCRNLTRETDAPHSHVLTANYFVWLICEPDGVSISL